LKCDIYANFVPITVATITAAAATAAEVSI
jgi:hypothetical protein